jgi:hypothetical protein
MLYQTYALIQSKEDAQIIATRLTFSEIAIFSHS